MTGRPRNSLSETSWSGVLLRLTSGAVAPGRSRSSLIADRLDVQLDLDLVADDQAAGLEDRAPAQPELPAADRRPGLEPDHVEAVLAPRPAGQAGVERD